MLSRRLCESCFREASLSSQAADEDITVCIKEAVKESVRSILPSTCSSKEVCLFRRMQDEGSPGPEAMSSDSEAVSDAVNEQLETFSLDFSLILSFISGVKQAIEWEEDTSATQKHR